MIAIIRLSKAGRENEAKKLPDSRVRLNASHDYTHSVNPETPEQQAVCEALNLTEFSSLRLGDYVQSSLTRLPYVRVIQYDAPLSEAEIWQQLEVMVQQYPQAVNDAITAF